MFNIKSIEIENFKNIKHRHIPLSQLHEIFGSNAVGKTAVQEAAEFACSGGKNDVDKIKLGEEKTKVTLVCEHIETKLPLKIDTTLTRKGNLYCNANFNGIKQVNPRTFIKKLISFGSFDPRELLDKKTREERILNLLPLYIKREDVKTEAGEPFPVQLWEEIDFDRHAWNALKQVRLDLYNARLSLYQKKDILKKAFEKQRFDLSAKRNEFFKKYEKKPEDIAAVKDILLEAGAKRQKQSDLDNELEKVDERIRLNTQGEINLKEKLEHTNKTIEDLEASLRRVQQEIENENRAWNSIQESLKQSAKEKEELEKEKVEKKNSLQSVEIELKEIEVEETKSTLASHLQKIQSDLEGDKKAMEKAVEEHKKFDNLIRKEFPKLVKRILDPIRKKLPGLEFSEEGNLTWNKISLDTLSGSETVILGFKLFSLDKKGCFIFVNEAEALDDKSMEVMAEEAKKVGKQVIAIRVADKPSGGDWNSTEIKND